MFSPKDAESLRASLEPMRFQGQAEDSELLSRYRAHYGLNFSSSERPVSHQLGTFEIPAPTGHYRLVCHYFALSPSEQRGTAFLLHGYFDHVGLFTHLIRHCLDQGLAVVIFDFPGHGLSSGRQASIDSFTRYVSALQHCLQLAAQQSVPRPWYFIGQSTGAAVLIDALLGHGISQEHAARRIILLAPLLRPVHWVKTRLLFSLSRLFLAATPRSFSDNSHDEEFLQFLRQHDALQSRRIPRDWVAAMIDFQSRFRRAPVANQTLYVIQGTNDETVDWRYNLQQLQLKFPAMKTYMVTDARHHMVNESLEFRERIFSLVSEIIQSEEIEKQGR